MSSAHRTPRRGAKGRLPCVALLIETSRTYGRGILQGIAQYAHLHGPWSFFTVERELHSGIPAWLNTWQGDGVIARIEDRAMAARLRRLGCPVVDVLGQARFAGIPAFDTDARAVARLAADFFFRAGFAHFAYSGYPGLPFSDRRGDAFRDCLRERGQDLLELPGLPPQPKRGDIQAVEQHALSALRRTADWIRAQPRPLAVFACNDVRAQQVLNACRESGLRVPEDVAVMGVDNDDVLCNLCDPPLTSIEPDTARLGHEAARLLDRLMRGERAAAPFTSIPPSRLVERTSTDIIAIDDPVMAQAVRFIRNEIGRGIAVKDVLAHVARSRTDLERRFHRWLGASIHDELLRRRLERVRALLEESSLGLQAIADRSGLSTAAHLCRLFQQHFHLTPSEYRRRKGSLLSPARPRR